MQIGGHVKGVAELLAQLFECCFYHPVCGLWTENNCVLCFAFNKLGWWKLMFLTTAILFLSCIEITILGPGAASRDDGIFMDESLQQGLSRSCCKLSPMKIPSSRLAAPGSPRMRNYLFEFTYCFQFEQTRTWWLWVTPLCERIKNLLISTPVVTMVKSYSFNEAFPGG